MMGTGTLQVGTGTLQVGTGTEGTGTEGTGERWNGFCTVPINRPFDSIVACQPFLRDM